MSSISLSLCNQVKRIRVKIRGGKLSGEGNPSDKFWALEERIRQDKKDSGVQAEMSRSNMKFILMDLLDEGAITAADLDGFSDDLLDSLLTYIELRKNRVDQ